MFGRFLPRETNFFDLFEQHADVLVQATQSFLDLTVNEGEIKDKARFIKDLEHEADQVAHRCIEALHKTFITPFEREDIYQLISKMDDVIDYIEETAARMAMYKLTEMRPPVKQLANILILAAQEVEKSIHRLRHLKNIEEIRQMLQNIHDLENQADIVLRSAVGQLFDEEQDIRLLIKWKEVYENIENAIDRCRDVSHIVEGVILEYS